MKIMGGTGVRHGGRRHSVSKSSAEKRERAKLDKYRNAGITSKVILFVVELFGRIGPGGGTAILR